MGPSRGSATCRRPADAPPTWSSSAPGPPAPAPPTGWRSAGLDVVVLEKAAFPREKVCGDGLTPRGVKALEDMGIDTSPAAGWVRHKGLRVHGGGQVVEVDWPQLDRWPDYSLVRRAQRARRPAGRPRRRRPAPGCTPGSRSPTRCSTTPAGSSACTPRPARTRSRGTWRAPLVVSAEGLSGRLAKSLGLVRREDRPLGVAVRRYVRTPRTADDYLDISFDLSADGPTAASMPGYGWVFGMGDGTANVGFGLLDTRRGDGGDHREVLRAVAGHLPGRGPARTRSTPSPRCAAPACRWRCTAGPPTRRGLLLAGDSAGTVNPFNGEGISYAMETGRMAAETAVDALARARGPGAGGRAAPLPGPAARRVRPAPPARHGLPRAARAARTSSGSPPRTASSGPRWSTPRCG